MYPPRREPRTREQLADLLDVGRHPIVVGEPGVGKSALVYELVRRAAGGDGPRRLAGKRVLQLSLRHRLSGLLVQTAALAGRSDAISRKLDSLPDRGPACLPEFQRTGVW